MNKTLEQLIEDQYYVFYETSPTTTDTVIIKKMY